MVVDFSLDHHTFTFKHTQNTPLHPLTAGSPGERAHLLTSSDRGVKGNLTQGFYIPQR